MILFYFIITIIIILICRTGEQSTWAGYSKAVFSVDQQTKPKVLPLKDCIKTLLIYWFISQIYSRVI